MQERLEAAEIWLLRRMLSIMWLDRMSNEAVLRKANTSRELMKMTIVRQVRFLGHVNGKEKIEHLTLTRKFAGKNEREVDKG